MGDSLSGVIYSVFVPEEGLRQGFVNLADAKLNQEDSILR
jgi:hypothetical protein